MVSHINNRTSTYKVLHGRNLDQISTLVKDELFVLSFDKLMQLKLNSKLHNGHPSDYLWKSYYDVNDACVRHPDGRLKIVHNVLNLHRFNAWARLPYGKVRLTDEEYRNLDGVEFSKSDTERYTGHLLSKREAKKSPIWRTLARGDKGLLSEYVDTVFSFAAIEFDYSVNMGVYPSYTQGNPIINLWYSGRLADRSIANGNMPLDFEDGRLIISQKISRS